MLRRPKNPYFDSLKSDTNLMRNKKNRIGLQCRAAWLNRSAAALQKIRKGPEAQCCNAQGWGAESYSAGVQNQNANFLIFCRPILK